MEICRQTGCHFLIHMLLQISCQQNAHSQALPTGIVFLTVLIENLLLFIIIKQICPAQVAALFPILLMFYNKGTALRRQFFQSRTDIDSAQCMHFSYPNPVLILTASAQLLIQTGNASCHSKNRRSLIHPGSFSADGGMFLIKALYINLIFHNRGHALDA